MIYKPTKEEEESDRIGLSCGLWVRVPSDVQVNN